MLALKRMALLSKSESSASSPITPGEGKHLLLFTIGGYLFTSQHNLKINSGPLVHTLFVLESPFSPEAEHALQTLEHKMQGPPQFTQSLKDQTVTSGSRARLSCHLTGTPQGSVCTI